jgi:transcriptional regulator with XRE-family HTH domain
MRLVEWRKKMGWTQTELAQRLGVKQPYVSLMERAVDPAIPAAGVMIEIFDLTGGAVQPNDFYNLPDLTAREAA